MSTAPALPAASTSALASAESKVRKDVSEYYSKVLAKTDDLKTNACTTDGRPPEHIIKCLSNISNDVIAKYYGCGLCIPDGIEGCTVLDLGCGSGRDVYIASQLVGKTGKVIGVDMTKVCAILLVKVVIFTEVTTAAICWFNVRVQLYLGAN